jgi:hypothetical protein
VPGLQDEGVRHANGGQSFGGSNSCMIVKDYSGNFPKRSLVLETASLMKEERAVRNLVH